MADKPDKQDRSDRLGKALRANLRRRKLGGKPALDGMPDTAQGDNPGDALERRSDPLAPIGRTGKDGSA